MSQLQIFVFETMEENVRFKKAKLEIRRYLPHCWSDWSDKVIISTLYLFSILCDVYLLDRDCWQTPGVLQMFVNTKCKRVQSKPLRADLCYLNIKSFTHKNIQLKGTVVNCKWQFTCVEYKVKVESTMYGGYNVQVESTMYKWRVQCTSGGYNVQVEGTMYKWRVQCTSEGYNVQV